MFERIILAAVITFCVYLFLNLGGNSSKAPVIDAKQQTIPEFIHRAMSFSFR